MTRLHSSPAGGFFLTEEEAKANPDDFHIALVTGRRFWPMDPKAADIDVEAMIIGLAHQPRFAGQTWHQYVVAQHCVLVSRRAEELARLAGKSPEEQLLAGRYGWCHDGAEGLGFGDMPSPIKRHLAGYKLAEKRLQRAVYQHFGLDPDAEPPEVKRADLELLLTENEEVRGWPLSDAHVVAPGLARLNMRLRPVSPRAARRMMVRRRWELWPELAPRWFTWRTFGARTVRGWLGGGR